MIKVIVDVFKAMQGIDIPTLREMMEILMGDGGGLGSERSGAPRVGRLGLPKNTQAITSPRRADVPLIPD